jgi:beta-galactosidase
MFWSQTYDDWEQIDLPHPTPNPMNPSQLLDETRFISDCVMRFAERQAGILRKHNKRWLITHNGLFNNINGPDLVKILDFFSHDQYPLFASNWQQVAAALQQARSLSFPFAILEQQSGPGGQMSYLQRSPRPGEMRLWAWQSVLHGAKAVVYFRWRTAPYGAEQHWHGLIDQDNRDNRRLAEATQLGEELRKLPDGFFDVPVVKQVAVVRDYDNEANTRRINTYDKHGQWEGHRWLAALARSHIQADIVWGPDSLDGYRVVIAPHMKIVDPELIARWTRFVEHGGTLILGAQSGLKDRNCHIVEMPLPGFAEARRR